MTSVVELRPASAFSAAELASTFNAGYAGYAFPISLDADAFSRYATLWDYALERSRVALADGSPVGIAVLAVRGSRGWIGGMGVAEPSRGTGVGRTLLAAVLEEAWAGRLDEVSLEVMEGNDAAIRLYESVGFELTRMLELWVLDVPVEDGAAAGVDVPRAHELIRSVRAEPEPWQRADETLARLVESATELGAFVTDDDGAAIVRPGQSVSVLQLAARDAAAARALLAAARSGAQSLSFVNVPEGSVASSALHGLGARLAGRQLEMVLAPPRAAT